MNDKQKADILFLVDNLFNKYKNCVHANLNYQREKSFNKLNNQHSSIDKDLMKIQNRIETLDREYDFYRNNILKILEGEEL